MLLLPVLEEGQSSATVDSEFRIDILKREICLNEDAEPVFPYDFGIITPT